MTSLSAFTQKWNAVAPSERADAQSYITELCAALDVEPPRPSGTGYEFEYPVRVVHRDGTETANFVDLFKEGHFLLESKAFAGTDGASGELRLRRAFGQVSAYAAYVPGGPPPYLMVLDVGRTLRVWDRWSGSYGGFQGATRTLDLTRLADRPDDAAFLRAVWQNPSSLDPNARAAAVTKEIAGKLATLASRLEGQGHGQERVARFLIRCVFTMFAEDVGLLSREPFLQAVEMGMDDPSRFEKAVAGLWATMDSGGDFGMLDVLRFNGHFFHDQDVIPLDHDDLAVLLEAARADWADVEPSIFGTLLTRALDREERHRLGAEFTPRAYVERLVRPTIEEPVRERWTMVQAEVLQLREKIATAGDKSARTRAMKRALKPLREFHDHLRSIRVLDPACGSGNFLYVSLSVLKEIELEVIREIEEITGEKEAAVEEVGPWQFHGIEIKPWAREVAELCLWVGHHQWWRRTHGHAQPPEPVLRDTGTLERRDAVLAWDEIREDPERSRPDPTPRIEHPVTGELVPDPEARLPYYEYVGARQAEWPEADFIVGNPPYMGRWRQREEFGDGYVESLRAAYPDVPENADYVMYWWYRAAEMVAFGSTIRAGLITTNSITQSQQRPVIEDAAARGARVVWAIPDHPWVDETGGADVRVAMTVTAKDPEQATRVEVDREGVITRQVSVAALNADLSAHADVSRAAGEALMANSGIAWQGVTLVGKGFVIQEEEASEILARDPRVADHLRPYQIGRDLAKRPTDTHVIDFAYMDEEEARTVPVLFDIVRDRVWPDRKNNRRASRAKHWWRFGEPAKNMRLTLAHLPRYIATPETSKHRFFTFLDRSVLPDHKIIAIGLNKGWALAVLSSRHHTAWALASGGRMGVGNDPVYHKTMCFDSFPFPDPTMDVLDRMSEIADSLDHHRKAALDRDDSVTMTGMYNVVEKLRSGGPLTEKELKVHEVAACGVLRDLHDELDRLVADAYGWPWPMETDEILARLVALHDERVEEEQRGLVRWLRPDYQVPRFGDRFEGDLTLDAPPDEDADDTPADLPDWPPDPIEQLTALRAVIADKPRTVEQAARRFKGAVRAEVEKHFEALEVLGVVARVEDGKWQVRGGVAVVVGK